jgi:proteasome alpha subunit
MGGQAESILGGLRERHSGAAGLEETLRLAVDALGNVGGEPRSLGAGQLEVAILDRRRPGRAFRRIIGPALTALLAATETAKPAGTGTEPAGAETPPAPAAEAGEAGTGTAPESDGSVPETGTPPEAES